MLLALFGVAVVLVMLVCTCGALAGPDYTWVWQSPIPKRHNLFAVEAANSTNAWAVGEYGTIMFWNGATLSKQYSGTTHDLYGVTATDATHAWAVGEAGTILFYNGSAWTTQASGTTYDLKAVSASDNTHVWAVGSRDGWHNATILFYNGTSWSVQKTYDEGGFQDVYALDATHVWAVDLKTYFFNGTSWSIINDGSTRKPYQVSAYSASDVWAVDWDGTILRSTNGGVTWGTTYYLGGWPVSISAFNGTNVYAVGWDGVIQKYNGASWTEQPSGTTQDLYDVCALDSTHIYSVGSEKFLFSRGGGGWTEQASGTTANLLDVDSVSADEAWAVGWNPSLSRGEVLRYYGGSWSLRATLNGYSIVSVAAAAGDSVWIVDEDGWIYKWNGSSWSTQLSIDYPLYDITALDTSHVWAVGATGMIRYTANGGTNWGTQASGTAQNLYGASALSTTSAWAVGANGTILFYDGINWKEQESPVPANLSAVSAIDEKRVWAVGDHFTILFYDGSKWTEQHNPAEVDLSAVSAIDEKRVWAVGDKGKTIYTGDGGSGWVEKASGTERYLHGVSTVGAGSAWAVGDAGTALFNGGSAWSALSGGTTETLQGVDALSADVVWAVGDNGAIQYTSSGGETWIPQSCPTTGDLNAVSAVSSTFAWAVGWNPSTSNGEDLYFNGSTWALKSTSAGESNTGVTAPAANYLWDVTSIGNIWRYRNGSWSLQYNDITDRPLNAVSAASTLYAWAVGDEGRIYRTTNGRTWGSQTSGTTENLLGVCALSTSVVWAVGANGTILYTSNGGTNWTPQASGTTVTLRGVSAVDSTHVWAVGDGGTICFYNGSSWGFQESWTTDNLYGVRAYDANNAWAVGVNGDILFADPPYIKYCSPNWGNTGQTVKVEIVGGYTHFGGASTIDAGRGVTVVPGSLNVIDHTHLEADLRIAPDVAQGPRDVNVTTGGETPTPLAGGFVVDPDPTMVGVSPPSAPPGWSGEVNISGSQTHFEITSDATLGAGVTVNHIEEVGPESVKVNVTISPSAAEGPRDVNVTTGPEVPMPLVGGFAVGNAKITSVNPASGAQGQTMDVAIVGTYTNFQDGVSAATFSGTGTTVNSTTVSDAAHATTNITISASATAGARDVNVRTGSEVPAPKRGGFSVVEQAPVVEAPAVEGLEPRVGPTGTKVAITGSNFLGSREGVGGSEAAVVRFNGVPAGEYLEWSDKRIECRVPVGATTGPVTVETVGGVSNDDKVFTVTQPVWYLAEGSTAWGFDTEISVENPNKEELHANVTYMDTNTEGGWGKVATRTVSLPPESQTTVDPRRDLGDTDFSTRVECLEGKSIAVDRTMTWTGEGAKSEEAHSSIGVTSPAKTWYLPEGSSAWGFECFLLIQNPNNLEATCLVTYMMENEEPQAFTKKIPANSRRTFKMANDIGEKDASIKVESEIPIIPERAMYRNNKRSGHDSIGTTAPAADYYLAEGTTNYGFTTYVLVQNPNDTATDVNVTYLTNSGPVAHPENPINMPANSRDTICVNDFLPGSDFSTQVSGANPIIAERAMYWGADTALGEASHDSIGMAEPHTTFYLPDGQAGDGYETYTLVANPNDNAVTVQITYLTPDGAGNVTFEESVGANSRMTYSMEDKGINGRAAVLVTSKTEGKKIMVERSMYWNNRGAGTDTIGGYSD
ncbi:MAG: IPT/TIG domain-containing protein [Planctomycetes bacterium]|nr:IPT/TIG domain-containing protein [Planctomycetota bacterium]